MHIEHTDIPVIAAAQALSAALQKHQATPILLILSGGSWLSVYEQVELLADCSGLTVSVIDERYDKNPINNNFAQLAATTFFKTAVTRGAAFIDTSVGERTAAQICMEWEMSLRTWRDMHQNGVVIATVGMGVDGHTAGIMPKQSADWYETKDWVVSYEVTADISPHQRRITVTKNFLINEVAEAVGYVVGETKQAAMQQLAARSGSLPNIPAQLFHEMKSVNLYCNQKG